MCMCMCVRVCVCVRVCMDVHESVYICVHTCVSCMAFSKMSIRSEKLGLLSSSSSQQACNSWYLHNNTNRVKYQL